jgi:hypothetical protein
MALRWRGARAYWLIAVGVALALTSFVSFGALAVGVIVLLATVWMRRATIGLGIKELLLVAVTFFVTWFVLSNIFPMQPWPVFSQAMAAHRFATVNSRSRIAWTLLNLLSFAVFCGWPVVVASLLAVREVWRERTNTPHLMPAIACAIGLAGFLVIVLLDLSGKALGEVERLWMFLLPPLCILAALHLRRRDVKIVMSLLFLQAIQTLLMAAWLAPLVLPI